MRGFDFLHNADDAVSVKRGVHAKEGQVLHDALCGKHPVKWVTMMKRQQRNVERMAWFNVQKSNAVLFHLFGDE